MDNREKSVEYEMIGMELIADEPELRHILNSDVRIAFLSSDKAMKHNGGNVLGQCERIQDKYKWAIPYDFTITIFEPNVERLSEEQLRIVLFHELLHVGIGRDLNGDEKYTVIPHDIEDFKTIIKRYGIDWSAI